MIRNVTILSQFMVIVSLVSGHFFWEEFQQFVKTHDKVYSSIEEFHRKYEVFCDNIEYIKEVNGMNLNYTLATNQFTDMKVGEFFAKTSFPKRKSGCERYDASTSNLASIDWRQHNAVTPVKNQGQCGSCWSFSATGAAEGAWAIKTDKLVSFSEQELVDCSKSYGNHGCNGGLMDNAFHFMMDNGICSESDYAYTASSKESCQTCDTVATVKSCRDVTPNNQQDLKSAVSMNPVSIAIEADTRVFQFYSGGVLSDDACGTNLDHGVLIVGFGEENNVPYWLVKNSWGDTWGDEGYIKILRSDEVNDPGICGIAMQPSFPVV